MMQELLAAHPEAAKARDGSGKLPLHYAAALGRAGVCEALKPGVIDDSEVRKHSCTSDKSSMM